MSAFSFALIQQQASVKQISRYDRRSREDSFELNWRDFLCVRL